MTSYQASAGSGKAAKFVAANPLGPMADPFAGMVCVFFSLLMKAQQLLYFANAARARSFAIA